jgi:tetratricopeptide (TPR) repeat protein
MGYGKLVEAEEMYQRALAGQEKTLGLEHLSTLNTVNNLGMLKAQRGKLVEAEEMYQRALAGYGKVPQSETGVAFNIARNLGLLYRDQGKVNEAKRMLERAASGREKLLGPDHPQTLEVVDYLKQLGIEGERKAHEGEDVVSQEGGYGRVCTQLTINPK